MDKHCDCDYILENDDVNAALFADLEYHYDNCSSKGNNKKAKDGTILLSNPNLHTLENDVLYHLGLDTKNYDLNKMFGDVKFVCMGGTKHRMRNFANYMATVLELNHDGKLVNVTKKSERYAMYKVGPVLSVSHGIGIPSMTVVLQEVLKLLHYARAVQPIIIRIGSCGGLALPPGSVVISTWAINGLLEKCYELPVLGKPCKFPALFDTRVSQELRSMVRDDDQFETVLGGTMAADDYYRGQGRLDGPFCHHTEEEKMSFLQTLRDEGVRNIEMEATAFAAITREAGLRAADVCVTFINRLQGDQITPSKETMTQWQTRPMLLVGRYIKQYVDKNLK